MDDLILENKQQARELAAALAQFDAERKAKVRGMRDSATKAIIGDFESANKPVPQGDALRELQERDLEQYLNPSSGLTLDSIDYPFKPEDLIREDGMGISMEDPWVRGLVKAYRERLQDANK